MKLSNKVASPLRYAGGKSKVASKLVDILAKFLVSEGYLAEFREPFFGGGCVGLRVLNDCPMTRRVWFNDRDPALCALWESIARRPSEIEDLARKFTPSVASFFEYQDELRRLSAIGDMGDRLDVAFKKLAVQRTSHSALGTRAGGPIGGLGQTGQYRIDCRYKPDAMARSIEEASRLLLGAETHPDVCSCLDFEIVIRAPGRAVFYFDPPYVAEGPGLYQFSFGERDHRRLADLLSREKRPWLLSYDRHPLVEELYSGWAKVSEFGMQYSGARARPATELLISNRNFESSEGQVEGKWGRGGNASEDLLRN